MNPKLTHLGALILAVAGGILATADTITPIAAINPAVAHLWPFVSLACVAVLNIGKLLQPQPPTAVTKTP